MLLELASRENEKWCVPKPRDGTSAASRELVYLWAVRVSAVKGLLLHSQQIRPT